MTYSQLLKIVDETGLSPEKLAPRLGVSNMTIRRWRDEKPNSTVPVQYEKLLIEAVHQLVIDGTLEASDPKVSELLKVASSSAVGAAMHELGIDELEPKAGESQNDGVVRILQRIGISSRRQKDVDNAKTRIWSFRKKGADWKSHLSTLLTVIKSRRVGHVEKLVAYGALFYLLCPFDLIPDHIPILGLTDDFSILTIAVAYYVSRGFAAKGSSSPDTSGKDDEMP